MKQKSLILCALITALLAGGEIIGFDDPPGVIVNENPDRKNRFITNPSLAILPSGTLIATHEYYQPKTRECDTLVFSSRDRGRTWKQTESFEELCWATVFTYRDRLYLMGATKPWGNMVIRRSEDEGETWTTPADTRTGLLSEGTQYHCMPVPMPVYNGRIWRSVGRIEKGKYAVSVMSAPEDSNLLDASNWLISDSTKVANNFLGGSTDRLYDGSIVPGPNGSLFNVMRIQARKSGAAILPVSNDGKRIGFEPSNALVNLPGSKSKFIVRYDDKTRRYWSLVNLESSPAFAFNNILALVSSPDLSDWKVETILLQHIDSKNHGFQKTFWQFDSNDIVAVSATAWENGLQPNYCTFHRFKNFRNLTMKNLAPLLGNAVAAKHQTDDLIIRGVNMSVASFRNGERLFGNWTFKMSEIPTQFEGWSFTRINAASRADMSVTAKRDCELYFATGTGQGLIDVTGWKAVERGTFRFSEKEVARMAIFKRSVRAGEVIQIPQGSWSGGIVLIPPGS